MYRGLREPAGSFTLFLAMAQFHSKRWANLWKTKPTANAGASHARDARRRKNCDLSRADARLHPRPRPGQQPGRDRVAERPARAAVSRDVRGRVRSLALRG